MTEARRYNERAISASPTYAEAYNNLGVVYRDLSDVRKSVDAYKKCLELDPHNRNAGQNRLLALNYLEDVSVNVAYEESAAWGAQFVANSTSCAAEWPGRRRHLTLMNDAEYPRVSADVRRQVASEKVKQQQYRQQHGQPVKSEGADEPEFHQPSSVALFPARSKKDQKLKLGLCGPDFCIHSVSYFTHGPLLHFNRENVHVTIYVQNVREDDKTRMFKGLADVWRPILGLSANAVCDLVRQDEIDVLIDLAGHTAHNRLDVFACRPCPVQVTWIGYPNTTGLPTIDYRLSDSIADPENTIQQFSEKLVRLPGKCFLSYTPTSAVDEVAQLPADSNGFITFGAFNNIAKVGTQVIELWAQILLAVPHSRLLMKAKLFVQPEMQEDWVKRFTALGIEAHRIDLVPLVPDCTNHLKMYDAVDIALDTFPYAGTTTTCEAFLMGVPVVTLAGESCHAQNVGASLCHAVGLEKLVAADIPQYLKLATELAHDVDRLRGIRASLRPQMMRSRLCDGARFTRSLELVLGALLEIWFNSPDGRRQGAMAPAASAQPSGARDADEAPGQNRKAAESGHSTHKHKH
eukprot:GHVT01079400.1.p1 GENE.GHVT01079400.1~~GHVT01079400.1.p1  ORF type:complete len:623 (+),score=137.03 GHVT01079400.1:139-1869(+)